ncbi:MAG: hypothetical protein RBR86_05490 [Pseudobdellovibrionaceae bacterium]|jgi:hypothetical protein|nr:hypothetical protein [Pseudobdellovibrionaceae bacterium]
MSDKKDLRQQHRANIMPTEDFEHVRQLVVAIRSQEEMSLGLRQQVAGLNREQIQIFQQMMNH